MAMKPSADAFQVLMELRQVTERFPTGEIKDTIWINEIWVDFDQAVRPVMDPTHSWVPEGMDDQTLILAPLSNARTEQLMREGKQTMRRKVIEPYEQGME
jgi:hypothetical protein